MMAIEYSVENVSVVDFQVTGRLNSQGLGDERFVSRNRQLPAYYGWAKRFLFP